MIFVAKNLVLRAKERGWEFTVSPGSASVLGRLAEQADICVPDLTVGRRHARVFARGGSWYIEDLKSRCGVFVNGRPVRGAEQIGPGDAIRLGAVELEVLTREAPTVRGTMDPHPPSMDATRLGFCTRCGRAVPTYSPSTASLHDAAEYGSDPGKLDAEPHYWCSFCGEHWLAASALDTGGACPACSAFMPLAARHCGACGEPLRARGVRRPEKVPDEEPARQETPEAAPAAPASFERLLETLRDSGASDLHLVAREVPRLRLGNALRPVDHPPLDPGQLTRDLRDWLTDLARRRLEAYGAATFAWVSPTLGRFRVHVQRCCGSLAATVRAIPAEVTTFHELGLPGGLVHATDIGAGAPCGLFLVTGPAGSGRSTTVAAILSALTASTRHIVTYEDPIEYVLRPDRALVAQHEIGTDVPDLVSALAAARRADADVVYAGELREASELEALLQLGTPDRLVLATLPTLSFVETVRHLLDLCPAQRRREMRLQLAERLACVLSQRLLPRAPGEGRVLAAELVPLHGPTRKLLREGSIDRLYGAIQMRGGKHDPQTMNQSLATLYFRKQITLPTALMASPIPEELQDMITRGLGPARHGGRPPAAPGKAAAPEAPRESAAPKPCGCNFGPGTCHEPASEGADVCDYCGDAPFHNHCTRCGSPIKGRPDKADMNARCQRCGESW